MKNEIALSFCIWDFEDITHDEITERLGIKPSKMHVKGQPKNPKSIAGLITKNGWFLDAQPGREYSFEVKMDFLMNFFKHNREVLSIYGKKYYSELSCAIYIDPDTEESTPWVHLTKEQMAMLNELSIEFDIDIILISDE